MQDFSQIRALLHARRPGHTLPQALYNSADALQFDIRAIFWRHWLLAGFECELPRPGTALALNIGGSPIVIVRDKAGTIRGFHNSCRHRGAMLCPPGRSQRSALVCPYHQWSFDLTGRLLKARRMQANFDPASHNLLPIHVRAVAGVLYVCLAEEPPPFDAFAAGLETLLAPHDLRAAKVAHEATFLERGNWKLVMENARECYHCSARHPNLSLAFPAEVRKHFDDDDRGHTERFNARMREAGLPIGPSVGSWWQAIRFALNERVVSLTMDGTHAVRRLMVEREGGDIGSVRWATEPNAFCHAVADHVFAFSCEPVGANETLVTAKWLVHADAVEGVDYRLDNLTALWLTTNNEDIELVENNQAGVNSIGYVPGPYCEEAESLVIRFVDWYCEEALRAFGDLPRAFGSDSQRAAGLDSQRAAGLDSQRAVGLNSQRAVGATP